MCRYLYVATDAFLSLGSVGKLTVEEVQPDVLEELESIFSKPSIRYVGVEGGCGCAFRHVTADVPSGDYDDQFFHLDDAERQEATTVLSQLLGLLEGHAQAGVELYLTWADTPVSQPRGSSSMRMAELRPERFAFIEGHMYCVLS